LRRHSLRALENEYLGKIESEKRHSENLLRNILPAEIVTRLRNGKATSRIISMTPPLFLPTSSASARSRRG
jgi:hypothetical protein